MSTDLAFVCRSVKAVRHGDRNDVAGGEEEVEEEEEEMEEANKDGRKVS